MIKQTLKHAISFVPPAVLATALYHVCKKLAEIEYRAAEASGSRKPFDFPSEQLATGFGGYMGACVGLTIGFLIAVHLLPAREKNSMLTP